MGVPMITEGLEKKTLPIIDRGTLGEFRYLSRHGGEWCAPPTILRRNYSVKEELTSWEGCAGLGREGCPQTPKEP